MNNKRLTLALAASMGSSVSVKEENVERVIPYELKTRVPMVIGKVEADNRHSRRAKKALDRKYYKELLHKRIK